MYIFVFAIVLLKPIENFTASSVSNDSVLLSWQFPGGAEIDITDLIVTYTTGDNFKTFLSDSLTFPEGGIGSVPTSTVISGLEPNTQYSFYVLIRNDVSTVQSPTIYTWTLPLSEFVYMVYLVIDNASEFVHIFLIHTLF